MNPITTTTKGNEAASKLVGFISPALKDGKRVFWLASGGSSLQVATDAMKLLGRVDTTNLTITLVDDVFNVAEGNKTNAEQLEDLGFQPREAKYQPIITAGLNLEETVQAFEDFLTNQLQAADFSIGQFGLGAGMHTGGIQPHSPAAAETTKLAIGYDDKGLLRVTITPALIKRLDVVFVNSFGEEKRPLVKVFLNSNASIEDEPTQALKTAKKSQLFSDVI